MKLLRIILFPIVPAYWLVTWFRNVLYNNKVFTSKAFDLPIICVGNLSVGGTGKTPMVEFLIRLLIKNYRLATLSRGYKRSSTGFMLANEQTTVDELGDEPFQFHKKFPEVSVAVDANRINGIEQLKSEIAPEIILLDDAFQHRKVTAGFNVLLTSYHNPFYKDIVLPTGNLREPRNGAKRASAVVVTKCPKGLGMNEQEQIASRIQAYVDMPVFFSYIDYSNEVFNLRSKRDFDEFTKAPFVLVTGIANPKPLVAYLTSRNVQFEHKAYPDHHNFTQDEIVSLKKIAKPILTTEKDFWRLESRLVDQITLFYLPIEMKIFNEGIFNELITSYVTNFSS